ncbi:MAG TPA: aminoacyl-tRNA hydrolase [Planctomycetota bacterium]|nr:aminoacyl-tRNA hydrolase [Planctomycetota bacterium]
MGLGNPGSLHARSRHNAGFLVVDRFASREGFPRAVEGQQVSTSERNMDGEDVILVKPRSYMNRSGPAVRDFLFTRAGLEDALAGLEEMLLVVHDDLDLPAGRIRFRSRGSSGGHNGVASLIEALGTEAFSRLKVGIGRPPTERSPAAGPDGAGVGTACAVDGGALEADYVLEPLTGVEEKRLLEVTSRTAETLPFWIREGTKACANRFNGESF